MSLPQGDDPALDARLKSVLANLKRRLDAGEEVDRETLTREHPDLAEELGRYFSTRDRGKTTVAPEEAAAIARAGPARPPLAPNSRFGDYELLSEIARGGMGVVYKARQMGLNRIVAVKMVLAGQLADQAGVQRFRAEAEAAAHLQHPNIVAVHEVGEIDGQHYFSMDYVEGTSLAAMVRESPLPARRAAGYVKAVAEAIHYAHEKGILHRDLKPSNVLIDRADQPRLTDFGLAKRVADERDLTGSGAVLGTPSYMPPEQADRRRGEIGPWSDVYSLGAVLYELLTGRPPFEADTPLETLAQVLDSEPAAPRVVNPGIPRDLETVCLKCLAKEPGRRYASAQALADDLGRYLAGEPVKARPVGRAARLWRWCKRRPAVAASLLALVAVLVGATVVSTGFAVRATRERRRADARTEEAQRYLYASRIHLAEAEWVAGNVDRADQVLAECASEPSPWEWRYLKRLCHPEVLTIPVWTRAMAFSPRTNDLALSSINRATDQRSIVLVDADTGKVAGSWVKPQKTSYVFSCLSFSPDGSRLATLIEEENKADAGKTSPQGALTVWDVAARKEVFSVSVPRGWLGRVQFSADGAWLLVSDHWTSRLTLLDAKTGKGVRTIPDAGGPAAFSADGRRIAAAAFTSTEKDGARHTLVHSPPVRIWDASTGNVLLRLPELPGSDQPGNLAFSPDGRLLAVCGMPSWTSSRTDLFDAKTGQHLRTLFGGSTPGLPYELAFSPDSQLLATAHRTEGTAVWEAASGRLVRRVRGAFAPVAFYPDGRRLATGSYGDIVKVWDIAAESASPGVRLSGVDVGRVLFSPDGGRLFVLSDQAVGIYDAATGQRLGGMVSPLDSKVMLADMAISPDGQQLATMARLNGQPGDPDCEVRVWDPRRGKEVLCFKRPPAPRLDDVAFAGNERLALRHAAGGIEICDSTTGRSIATLPQLVQNVAVSPDGRQIAARAFLNQKPHLCIWDAATGREVASYPADVEGGFGKPTLVYSPDGLFLAAPKAWRGGPQPLHPIALRLAATGKEVLVMKGHSGLVNALAFSPDGKRLVSGSEDQTLKVWDLATGQALLTLRGHQDGVRTVAFSPDGRRIASATRSEVRLWDAPPESADEERRKFEIGPPEGR